MSDSTIGTRTGRGAVLRRLRLSDLLFHNLTRLAALLVLALLSGVILIRYRLNSAWLVAGGALFGVLTHSL